ncbi:GldG family protein [Candidatus Peregrinibacteria bacterium]|nr:GldG family protein [Candidatus Peregrinibacteria bacterium]
MKLLTLTKKTVLKTHSLVSFIIILGIIFLANIILSRHFVRLDLTSGKEYTISDSTKNLLKNIDDVVTIKVFFSQKLPPNLLSVSQYVHDILDEYRAYGNIRVEYIDPASDPKVQQEVAMLEIPEIQMNVIEKDKLQVQNGYLGIGIFYVNKKEVLPFVQNTENLEYQLTSALRKVTATEIKKIGFLTGHDEHSTLEKSGDYTLLRQSLEKNYETQDVSTSDGKAITGISTLIVAGPKTALQERDIFEIDQFIMNGGNAIFLVDSLDLAEGLQMTPLNNPQLNQLLQYYGVSVEQNLVLDTVHETASFSQGFIQFILPYPLWPKLIKDNFSVNSPIVAKLDSLVLPWVSSLTITQKEGLNYEVLAKTTNEAWTQTGSFNLDPNQRWSQPSDTKNYDMAVLVSNFTKSYFSGKSIPPVSSSDPASNSPLAKGSTSGDVTSGTSLNSQSKNAVNSQGSSAQLSSESTFSAGSQTVSDSGRTIKESPDSNQQIIVIGDSDFLSDQFAQRFPQNLDFGLNMIDYLTLDNTLISIRSKGFEDRPLTTISDGSRNTVKIFGILGMPILVVLYGVIRLTMRKRRQSSEF